MRGAEKRRFTISELRGFDGRNERPAYIAFKGKVYDVSDSKVWTGGMHLGRHFAGNDLTNSIMNAPHNEEKLMSLQVVGELIQEESLVKNLVQRGHPHPMLVHFSIAYSILVSLLSILYVVTGELSFEIASYYVLVLAFVVAPAAGLTGLFSWKVTYKGKMTEIFAGKIILTFALIFVVTACFILRTLDPNILTTETMLSYIYLALAASLSPIVAFLGYFGGKIVYP